MILAVLSAGGISYALLQSLVVPALPEIQSSLHTSESSIIRDEFPNERVPGSIGLVSSLLGIGGGAGVVLAGLVTQNLSYHWLFWSRWRSSSSRPS